MPVSFLTEAERQHRSAFPNEIAQADLITFFTLSSADLAQIRKQRGSANRFGFAPQLCALRYLGFFPQQQETIPDEVIGSEALRRGMWAWCSARRLETGSPRRLLRGCVFYLARWSLVV